MKKIIKLNDIKKFCAKDLYSVIYKDVVYFGIYSEDKTEIYLPTVHTIIDVKDLTKTSISRDNFIPERIFDSEEIYDENNDLIIIDQNSRFNLTQLVEVEKQVNYQRYTYQVLKVKSDREIAQQREIRKTIRSTYDFFNSNEKI